MCDVSGGRDMKILWVRGRVLFFEFVYFSNVDSKKISFEGRVYMVVDS